MEQELRRELRTASARMETVAHDGEAAASQAAAAAEAGRRRVESELELLQGRFEGALPSLNSMKAFATARDLDALAVLQTEAERALNDRLAELETAHEELCEAAAGAAAEARESAGGLADSAAVQAAGLQEGLAAAEAAGLAGLEELAGHTEAVADRLAAEIRAGLLVAEKQRAADVAGLVGLVAAADRGTAELLAALEAGVHARAVVRRALPLFSHCH